MSKFFKVMAFYALKISPKFIIKLILNTLFHFNESKPHRYARSMYLNGFLFDFEFTKCHKIIGESELNRYLVDVLEGESYEIVKTSYVKSVAEISNLNLFKPKIQLFCFQNAMFVANSDIVVLSDGVYYQKVHRPQFAMTVPVDVDFLHYSQVDNVVYLLSYKNKRKFRYGFNLCGVHVNAWAHFILSYLPKAICLSEVELNQEIAFFVPRNIHAQILQLLEYVISKHPHKHNINVVFVDNNEHIECENLYYFSDFGYLVDHGFYTHPFEICITRYGYLRVFSLVKELVEKYPRLGQPKKLFIGRRGGKRTLTNYDEVESFFISKGFEVVYPHLMTLEQKIQTFSNVTHICGPASSGLTNLIFSLEPVKVLAFVNFARCFDPLLETISYLSNIDHEIRYMTGWEKVSPDLNSSYFISLHEIEKFAYDINFIDEQ